MDKEISSHTGEDVEFTQLEISFLFFARFQKLPLKTNLIMHLG